MKPWRVGPMRDGVFRCLWSLYAGLPFGLEFEAHLKRRTVKFGE